MKDEKKLQEEFDEYFGGVNLPDNMTADAKLHVKRRKNTGLIWLKRLAPIAAAAVLIVAFTVFFNLAPRANGGSDGFDSPQNQGNTSPQYSFYTADKLIPENMDITVADKIAGLKFTEKFIFKKNVSASVTAYSDAAGRLIFAEINVSLIYNGYRHDGVIIAEFTDRYVCLDDMKDYLEGSNRTYYDMEYVYNGGEDKGEPVHRVFACKNDVKYYISVTTAQKSGYMLYVDWIYNN